VTGQGRVWGWWMDTQCRVTSCV